MNACVSFLWSLSVAADELTAPPCGQNTEPTHLDPERVDSGETYRAPAEHMIRSSAHVEFTSAALTQNHQFTFITSVQESKLLKVKQAAHETR